MPFLPPIQQRQSTEDKRPKQKLRQNSPDQNRDGDKTLWPKLWRLDASPDSEILASIGGTGNVRCQDPDDCKSGPIHSDRNWSDLETSASPIVYCTGTSLPAAAARRCVYRLATAGDRRVPVCIMTDGPMTASL